jgi:CarboxypepD_reg-like domain
MQTIYKLIIILLFIQGKLFAQSFYIKGIVADNETGVPLANASVFINNSTTGTVTNSAGEFQLGPFAPGTYEVVASFVGYERLLYIADIRNAPMKITFRMTKRDEEMRELLILPEATRVRYLEIFRKNLLGETSAANRAKVKNLKEVQFAATPNRNELVAYCETTLVVDNPELGYMVYFDLVEFYFNQATGESRFFGYTRFVDKNDEGENKRRWAKKRKEAYEGSSVHFFRSLVQRKLKEEKFTVQNIYKKEMKQEVGTPQKITLNFAGSSSFDIAVPVTEDSLLQVYSDSGYTIYEIKTADRLRILFAKNTALKQDITKNRIVGGQVRDGTIAGLRPYAPPILVDYRGRLLTPMAAYYDGMWAFERLANMLPEDYVPE